MNFTTVKIPDYVESAVWNAVHDRDFEGLDPDEDYSDYNLFKYHADIRYETKTAKSFTELEQELKQEFGEAFNDKCDYTIDKWGERIIVMFQTECWYWYSEEWGLTMAEAIASVIPCRPDHIENVTQAF